MDLEELKNSHMDHFFGALSLNRKEQCELSAKHLLLSSTDEGNHTGFGKDEQNSFFWMKFSASVNEGQEGDN